jgi:very-short-patch-repair endonuclease
MKPPSGKTTPARGLIEERGDECRYTGPKDTRFVKVLGSGRLLPVSGGRDERVAAIAGAQRGRVTSAQLLQAGLSRHVTAGMVTAGRMQREHRGVFVVGHAAAIPLGREAAALLACGWEALLSRGTAAALWGMVRTGNGRAPVEVTIVGAWTRRQRRGIVSHRSHLITPRDAAVKDGLPVTSPAWTLLDLAASATPRQLERALDEALAQRLVSPTKLRELLGRTHGHPGRRSLTQLIADWGPSTITRSEAEERMLALIRAAQLPAPQVNVRVCGYEVDLYWPAEKLVVEVDGFQWHSGRVAFERDRRKGMALAAAGTDLVRVSWTQLEHGAVSVAAAIAAAIARARAQ